MHTKKKCQRNPGQKKRCSHALGTNNAQNPYQKPCQKKKKERAHMGDACQKTPNTTLDAYQKKA